jgi:hypothetical protein
MHCPLPLRRRAAPTQGRGRPWSGEIGHTLGEIDSGVCNDQEPQCILVVDLDAKSLKKVVSKLNGLLDVIHGQELELGSPHSLLTSV